MASVQKNKSKVFLPITIQCAKNALVQLSIDNSDLKLGDPKRPLYTATFQADTSGNLYYSCELKDSTVKTVLVQSEILVQTAGDTTTSLTKRVKLKI